MGIILSSKNVDIAKYAIRKEWVADNEYTVIWEDPRDIYRAVVRFASLAPKTDEVVLQYWSRSWPRVHISKGAKIGAGESGWLSADDWFNGEWQTADKEVQMEGNTWIYTFHPLNAKEFPNMADFPVTFRRTLKLRLLFDKPGVKIEDLQVFTDSTWQETQVTIEWGSIASHPQVWDGYLEVFNGEVLMVEPMNEGSTVMVDSTNHWKSSVNGYTDGIRAKLRYAYNEDINSLDRTIITVRSSYRSFSFLVDEVANGEVIYIPDFGVIVSRTSDSVKLDGYLQYWETHHSKTLYQRIGELPEQTFEQAWNDMPPKKQFYFVLGCEGSRQKFGVDVNGDIFCPENFIRRVKGRDSKRLLWDGPILRYHFGFPNSKPNNRYIEEGYLPIIYTEWTDGNLVYKQEAFATIFGRDILDDERMQGDDPVIALIKITMLNTGDSEHKAQLRFSTTVDEGILLKDGGQAERLTNQNGVLCTIAKGYLRCLVEVRGKGLLREVEGSILYEIPLLVGASHTIFVKIPFITLTKEDEVKRLSIIDYDKEKPRVVQSWKQRVNKGAQITTPNKTLNNFYRAHLIHMLIVNDHLPKTDIDIPRCGGFFYGNYPDESCMVITDLDRRGYTAEAKRCLETFIKYQGTVPLPGNFGGSDGVFYGSSGYECGGYNRGQGWAMWGLAEHYWYTRDRTWLKRVASALIKSCDWITKERKATMHIDQNGRRLIEYGFLPSGSLEDVTDYWHWLSTNVYAYWGFQAIADVLTDIGHPEAPRLQKDAKAFRQNLMAGFNEACIRSPVIRLRDGRFVPHYPSRLERRGRDFGWLREVLEGAIGLIYSKLLSANDPASTWIIEDYEDNLYLSEHYGYANSIPDYERYWFSRGGFSMQPNLLLHPVIYLWRDDIKHFLRAYFNSFAVGFYPDTCMLTEHPLPTMADWKGDHFKTSDEANSTYFLRLMLIQEQKGDLFLGKAIPREWLRDGETIRIERALTYFGMVSYEIRSQAANGEITMSLEPPKRNPPEHIIIRFRHPECKPIRSVRINSKAYTDFDVARETIHLDRVTEKLEIIARY